MDMENSDEAFDINKHDNEERMEIDDEMQERDEIVKMWKHMDEKLEMKAKSLNLTAVNVKTILHHMIRNPQVISVIMGLDINSSIADLKLTRSKTKHLPGQGTQNDQKESNIVEVPRASRTFLDIDYEFNEEEDTDYLPEQDDDMSEEDVETELAGTSRHASNSTLQIASDGDDDDDDEVAPALHTRSKQQSNMGSDNFPNFGDDVLLYTAVDDPEYVEFISNLNDPSKYDLDETEDPEYNFLADVDAEDAAEEYELRNDRATEIPLREVENLLQDLMEARLLPSPEHLEQTIESVTVKDENKVWQPVGQDEHRPTTRKANTVPEKLPSEDDEPVTVFVDASLEDFQKLSATSSSLLCATVENPPFFSFYELQQLVAQLEKHVQLLTQFAVGCYMEKTMVKTYNGFQLMINELNDKCLKRPEHSLFNITNLDACIATCHDAAECESISDFVNRPRKPAKLEYPLPETMFVLSRSRALIFPELLPQVRMKTFPTFNSYFTREEECLLALGLYQFAHLKRSPVKQSCYALIKRHLLANKSQSQIRLHLKNFRTSKQSVHSLFVKAEKEMVNMIFPLENRLTAVSGPPYTWPQHLQPEWLQELLSKQQYGLECEDSVVDGLVFQKISNENNSTGTDPPVPDHSTAVDDLTEDITGKNGKQTFDKVSTFISTTKDTNDNLLEVANNSDNMKQTEITGISLSPVRNLLHFASSAECAEQTRSSSSSCSLQLIIVPPADGELSTMNSHQTIIVSPVVEGSLSPASHHSEYASSTSGISLSPGFSQSGDLTPSSDRSPLSPHSRDISPTSRKSSSPSSSQSRYMTQSSGGSPIMELAESVRNTDTTKQLRFAPFKKIPPKARSEMSESEESTDSDRSDIEMIGEDNESSGDETVSNSSSRNRKNRSRSKSFTPERIKSDGSNDDSRDSFFSSVDSSNSWTSIADTPPKNVGIDEDDDSFVDSSATGKSEEVYRDAEVIEDDDHENDEESNSSRSIGQKSSSVVHSDSENSYVTPIHSPQMYKLNNKHENLDNDDYGSKAMKKDTELFTLSRSTSTNLSVISNMEHMEDKGVQCNLSNNSQIEQAVQFCVTADRSRVTGFVHCGETDFAQDGEEVDGTKQEQNEEKVSSGENQNSENVADEQQQQYSRTPDDNKSSLPGDGEDDGSDGEENEPVSEEKRRRRVRTRKERERDGLHGMLDAEHRALQVKCMTRVIFNDFEQRMFMYRDKVRALCELVAEQSTSSETFEKMQEIFEEGHEPVYILLSFLFPQNLLPMNVLENPVRKAYSSALEMIYNIEAFSFFGSTKLSARTIFRNIRDLGLDCTCEAFSARFSELIGSKSPLWEIISRNIPTHICQSNYCATDFEYIDLDTWKKMEAPFESIDLTTAIGPETETERSGVFVGFLRNLYTERKGKLYEVVAEWKPTKCTPSAPQRRRPAPKRVKKRKSKKSNRVGIAKLSKSLAKVPGVSRSSVQELTEDASNVMTLRKNDRTLRFVRKRPAQSSTDFEKRKKRKNGEESDDGSELLKTKCGADYGRKMEESCGSAADIPLGNTAESGTVIAEPTAVSDGEVIHTERLIQPLVRDSERKWTIEEDRKMLCMYKENDSDLERTLALVQSELPGIVMNELKQRLLFLLSLLPDAEEADN